MSGFLSARVFSLVFAIVYTIDVVGNYAMFRYYPAVGRFSMVDLADKSLGPAMSWFGWMAWAFIFAIVAAAVVPRKLADRLPGALYWVAALAMFAAGFYREQDWFFK